MAIDVPWPWAMRLYELYIRFLDKICPVSIIRVDNILPVYVLKTPISWHPFFYERKYRPMHFCYSQAKTVLVWSSIWWMDVKFYVNTRFAWRMKAHISQRLSACSIWIPIPIEKNEDRHRGTPIAICIKQQLRLCMNNKQYWIISYIIIVNLSIALNIFEMWTQECVPSPPTIIILLLNVCMNCAIESPVLPPTTIVICLAMSHSHPSIYSCIDLQMQSAVRAILLPSMQRSFVIDVWRCYRWLIQMIIIIIEFIYHAARPGNTTQFKYVQYDSQDE